MDNEELFQNSNKQELRSAAFLFMSNKIKPYLIIRKLKKICLCSYTQGLFISTVLYLAIFISTYF